ncbi:MAG: hypothetical protein ABIP06_12985 [Pyrinomonadaceae bacterium]
MKNICLQRSIFAAAAIFFVLTFFSCRENKLLPETNETNVSRIPPDTLISISLSETLGQWFTLVISADGKTIYTPTKFNGYNRENIPPQNVAIESRISREQLEEIIREFENQKFFSLDDVYQQREGKCEGRVLDAGIRTVSIEIGGRKKTVRWAGCMKNGEDFPPEFFAVFDKITAIKNARR